MIGMKTELKSNRWPESDFDSTLREFIEGRTPIDSLLENPEFITRTKKLCLTHSSHLYDQEELYQDVCLALFKQQSRIKSLDLPEHLSFFRWLNVVIRNRVFDRIRSLRASRRYAGEELSTDLIDMPDPQIDLERRFYERELRARLMKCITSQSSERRLAVELCLLSGY